MINPNPFRIRLYFWVLIGFSKLKMVSETSSFIGSPLENLRENPFSLGFNCGNFLSCLRGCSWSG